MKKPQRSGSLRKAVCLFGVGMAALVVSSPSWASCLVRGQDLQTSCLTTPVSACNGSTSSVTIQIGGNSAEDSGDGLPPGTCSDGTPATGLADFSLSGNQLTITLTSSTCTTSSLTSFFFNVGDHVTGLSLNGQPAGAITTWALGIQPVSPPTTQNGFKADGFGHFDAVLYNGNNPSQGNGGNPFEILAGHSLTFHLTVTGSGYSLCDFISQISVPNPGDRNRVAVAKFQACAQGGSAFIGPCVPSTSLLARVGAVTTTTDNASVKVDWNTSLEIDNAGFNVLRREVVGGRWERVNGDLIPGLGDTVTGASYSFVDTRAVNGVEYHYHIESIDFAGVNDITPGVRAVANPKSPKIGLTSPAYGDSLSRSRPDFSFSANDWATVSLEISADPTFSGSAVRGGRAIANPGISPDAAAGGGPVYTVVRRASPGSNTLRLSRVDSRVIGQMADSNGGILYWRITDRQQGNLSQTYRVTITP